MKGLSISRVWDETRELLRRDGGAIAAIALALMVLPGTVANMVQPPAAVGDTPSLAWGSLLQLAALAIGIVGQLAVVQIALGRRQSVGQAIATGARRAPAFLGAMLLWIVPLVLAFAPFAVALRANPTAPDPISAAALVLLLPVFLFLAVRLIFTTPVAGAEPVGPLAILKRSWELTRGHWWKLFGALVLFFIAALVAIAAVTSVIGVIVNLLSGQPEPWSVGALVLTLTSQLLSALLTVLLAALLTRLYLQLAPRQGEPASVPHAP